MNVRIIIPVVYWHEGEYCHTIPQPYLKAIAHIAGGYTAVNGFGGWIDKAGSLIEEPILVVDIVVDPTTITVTQTLGELHKVCQTIAAECHQDCVFFQHGDVTEYVTTI